ncbi:Phosphoribosylglycinamide formyltransferase OS=Streptomyces microflavus OX=1919 GN=purN PE=3 SV=1 [Streptomyces microflavus]
MRDALAYGVKVTGCTVHFVDDGVDTGPIIAQGVVEVTEEDTPEGEAALMNASRKSSAHCSSRPWGGSPVTVIALRTDHLGHVGE